jgi:protoporphyrinogen/coproporphyrinogen III oxidase
MTDADVVVVGGGISGLTAARVLCARGFRVRLCEGAEECGGLVRTERIDGWIIDAGPDTLLAHKPAAVDLVRALGLGERLVAPIARRPTYVLRGRRLRTLPETSALGLPTGLGTLVRTGAFSWRGKLRMAAEALLPPDPPASDESIASFVGRRFGREAVAYVAEPVLAGIHRGEAAQLSIRALFPILADAERTHGSVCRAWRAAPSPRQSGGGLTLARGLGELTAALRDELPPDVLMTRSPVEAIHGKGPFRIVLGGGRALRARAVVLATPAWVTADLVAALDPPLAQLCGGIPYRSAASVALGYPAEAIRHPLDGWGFVVPRHERRQVGSVSWVTSKWPGRAPAGHVLMRASLPHGPDTSTAEQEDATLVEGVHRDLSDLLGISGAPVLSRVYRTPRAMPQLEVGHLERIAAIERRLAELPGVHITAGGFRGVGLPACISDATAVADRAAQALLA